MNIATNRVLQTFLVGVPLVLALIILITTQTQKNRNESGLVCQTTQDCVLGIQASDCCRCPQPVAKGQIGKEGWYRYDPDIIYAQIIQDHCKGVICATCQTPTEPVCMQNTCVFSSP